MTNKIQDLLERLAACLCAQIIVDESPEPCFCGVISGDAVVANYGSNCKDKNGMAWVRLGDLYPASGVGEQNITPGNCASSLGFDIEVGILRQIPKPKQNGQPPSDAVLLEIARQSTDDALTMLKAIRCCTALTSKDYILGNYAPNGPLGLITGGTWRVSVIL